VSSTEIVKTFISALQSGNIEVAAGQMADNFVGTGLTTQPLDKGMFLAMQSRLKDAMPDFSYNLHDLHEQDDKVDAFIHMSGTNTNDLELPMFGIPLIRATGLVIDLAEVHSEYILQGDRIVEMRVDDVPGGGIPGLLQQVGKELPVLPRLGDEDITRLNEWGIQIFKVNIIIADKHMILPGIDTNAKASADRNFLKKWQPSGSPLLRFIN
jgi:predicted ester cyclase